MAEYNRKNMIEAIKDHAKGHIKKHSITTNQKWILVLKEYFL